MDVIKEVGSDDLKFIFIKDDQSTLAEALYVKNFSEEKYKKLKKYIKERLGEEFTSIISLDQGKALVRVLLISIDQVSQSMINDVIDNEIGKVDSWISNGVIKELVDKVVSETKKTKRTKKSRKKKKSKKAKSGRKRARKKSRKKSSKSS